MKVTNEYLPSMLGISFWNKKDCETIKRYFNDYSNEEKLLNPKLYWDNIPVDHFDELDVTVRIVNSAIADEMDTVDNYYYICDKYEKHKK